MENIADAAVSDSLATRHEVGQLIESLYVCANFRRACATDGRRLSSLWPATLARRRRIHERCHRCAAAQV